MAFLTRYLGPSERHEEVVDEVMMVIWQQASEFRPTSRPSTWIFGIACRKALESYRRAAKALGEPVPALPNGCEEADLENIALEVERLDHIRKALNKLPPDQRTSLTLAFYHNCSQQEIATRTGHSLSTIKSQLRQGLRRMRIHLERM